MDTGEKLLDPVEEAVSHISAGRVLDVATGTGGFINFLAENLMDYTQIIGIDTVEHRLATARQAYPLANIRFMRMDAARMSFTDGHFDTVCIANSLHHMLHLEGVLAEMLRVCKLGGHIIISEMFRDDQSETQLTHVYLHHWWAAVDTLQGIIQFETFTREHILEIWRKLGLHNCAQFELKDLDVDPQDPELLNELDTIIDRYIQHTIDQSSGADLRLRGEELRKRVHHVGFHAATTLFLIGEK